MGFRSMRISAHACCALCQLEANCRQHQTRPPGGGASCAQFLKAGQRMQSAVSSRRSEYCRSNTTHR